VEGEEEEEKGGRNKKKVFYKYKYTNTMVERILLKSRQSHSAS
jgi:hypothetical protein